MHALEKGEKLLPLAEGYESGPRIAIIIDDVGLDRKRSARALKLPPEISMAFIPYSPRVQSQVNDARAKGHMILVHLPMEPERKTANPGPDYLGTDLPVDEVRRRVVKNLSAFTGYDGVNNHMGSKFTQDPARVEVLMDEIRSRQVFFLDSKTAPKSIAEKMARGYGIPTSHRDVFIDHYEDAADVKASLREVERIARKYGTAVAIGHPKDDTLDALEAWLPTLAQKGFRLATVGEVIALRNKKR